MTRVLTRRGTVVLLVVLAAALVAALVPYLSASQRHVTAYFAQAPNLYVGDQVRILGVEVGEITEITPQPDQVEVEMTYEAKHPVPAGATAAVVAPTLVSGRSVQLAPVYRGGPQLADGATIPVERTATPVEFDEIKTQITELARELGPRAPGDTRGALNRLLDVGADTLRGRGEQLRSAVRSLSEASSVLSDGRGDLFATVRNLQVVVSALAASDPEVDRFSRQLADVSAVLEDNGEGLTQAIATLDRVVPTIRRFVADNRVQLNDRLAELTRVTGTLAANRQELANLLQVAPTAFANLSNVYDQRTGSLSGALALTQLGSPSQFFCSLILGANSPGGGPPATPGAVPGPGSPAFEFCRTAAGSALDLLRQDTLQVPSLPGAGLPGAVLPRTTR